MNEKKAGGLTSRQKREIRNNLIGYSFIIPNLVGYSIFVFIPVIFSFVLSVMKWDGSQAPMQFVGLANFVEIFGDRVFRGSFVHTVQYAVMTVPFTLILSLLLAVLLNSKIKGVAIFRTAFYFPYIASIVAVGAVWNMLFQPDFGPVNEMLKAIGVAEPPRWVVSTDWAMVAVSIVSIWKYMGYYMIVYLAALQGISSSLYEAAQIDGANGWQRLLYITIPMLTPTTFFVLIMLTIQCFKVFDLVYVMTGGGPNHASEVPATLMYDNLFVKCKYGYGSAQAFFIVFECLLFSFLLNLIFKKSEENASAI